MTPVKWLDQHLDEESTQDKPNSNVSKISLISDDTEQSAFDLSQLSLSHSNLQQTRISLNNYDINCSNIYENSQNILQLSLVNCTVNNLDFRNVKNLQQLKLSQVYKMDVSQLSTLTQLQQLIIYSCQNFENLFVSIQNLDNLQQLKIMWTDLGDRIYIHDILHGLTHFTLEQSDTELLYVDKSFRNIEELHLEDVKNFVVANTEMANLRSIKLNKVKQTNINTVQMTKLEDISVYYQVTYTKIGIRHHSVMKRYEVIASNLLCVKKKEYIKFGSEQLNLDKYCLVNQSTGHKQPFNKLNSFEITLYNFVKALRLCAYTGILKKTQFLIFKHKSMKYSDYVNKHIVCLQ